MSLDMSPTLPQTTLVESWYKMYNCAVCHKQFSDAATAAQLGTCECGQGLANEQGIGWKHLNPSVKTPPAPPSLSTARESKPSNQLTGEDKSALNAANLQKPPTGGTVTATAGKSAPIATASTPQTISQPGSAKPAVSTAENVPAKPPTTQTVTKS